MENILNQIDPKQREFFERLGKAICELGAQAYLVGGYPRDLILGKYCKDIDVAIGGDALTALNKLKSGWSSYFGGEFVPPTKVVQFKRYGTGKLLFPADLLPDINVIDFSSTRSEHYPEPGKAPVVTPGDLRQDLARRDFSVNALAISISPESFGELHDYFDGRRHLANKELVVIHERSFIDDPARMIRASRFASRLDFVLDRQSEELFQQAIRENFLERLPAVRLTDEFRKALAEPDPERVLLLLDQQKMLEQILARAVLTSQEREDLATLVARIRT